jgi:predicted outer membrane repeat protein
VFSNLFLRREAKITLALLGALMVLCHRVSADTFIIADGDVDSLKDAITEANANGQDDTINLVHNGTYTLFTADNSTNGGNGLPVIGADGGNSLTFAGHGATIQRDPNFPTPDFRILQIGPGSVVTLDAMTIANGRTTTTFSSPLENLGGGVVNDHGTLTVTNCIFTQNQAGFGGGAISNSADGGSTSMSITDSTFRENSAGAQGGGIYHFGTGGHRNADDHQLDVLP